MKMMKRVEIGKRSLEEQQNQRDFKELLMLPIQTVK